MFISEKFDAFAQSTKTKMSFNLFATIQFPQKVPLDTQIAFMTKLPKIFRQHLDNFLQMKSENNEGIFFQKQPSKRSSRDVKCNFDKPAERFHQKVQKIFAQSLETIQNALLLKKSSERSPGQLECVFQKPADMFRQKSEHVLPNV